MEKITDKQISELMKEFGKRGGKKTAQRGPDWFRHLASLRKNPGRKPKASDVARNLQVPKNQQVADKDFS